MDLRQGNEYNLPLILIRKCYTEDEALALEFLEGRKGLYGKIPKLIIVKTKIKINCKLLL